MIPEIVSEAMNYRNGVQLIVKNYRITPQPLLIMSVFRSFNWCLVRVSMSLTNKNYACVSCSDHRMGPLFKIVFRFRNQFVLVNDRKEIFRNVVGILNVMLFAQTKIIRDLSAAVVSKMAY